MARSPPLPIARYIFCHSLTVAADTPSLLRSNHSQSPLKHLHRPLPKQTIMPQPQIHRHEKPPVSWTLVSLSKKREAVHGDEAGADSPIPPSLGARGRRPGPTLPLTVTLTQATVEPGAPAKFQVATASNAGFVAVWAQPCAHIHRRLDRRCRRSRRCQIASRDDRPHSPTCRA